VRASREQREPKMIVDVHVLSGEKDAQAVRVFLADVLDYLFVDADEWLVVAMSPAELGITKGDGVNPHEFYLVCNDLKWTVDDLVAKNFEITRPISETGLAYTASVKLPGGVELGLCQQKVQAASEPTG
jgi:predicted enzyme related to lactoylglutathione lyase